MRYYNLSSYFRQKYGKRLKKICIDAGFTCPNRDGTAGIGGCIFCGERGAGEHISPDLSITEQVKRSLVGAEKTDGFVAYFQNFTNTYASPDVLKRRYDAALIDKRIKVLAIGTRPDCIDRARAELIASYRDRVDVWVELGLQSESDEVGKFINRGYSTEDFKRAVDILTEFGIPVVAHVIIGLPTDTPSGVRKTIDFLSSLNLFGVKLHSIYVMRETRLAELYKNGSYTPPTLEEYISLVVYAVKKMKKDTVFHRLTGDCPKDMLIAPEWNENKNELLRKIQLALEEENAVQGELS